jgi:hypothetical protein
MIDYLKQTWSLDNLSVIDLFKDKTAHVEFAKGRYQFKENSDEYNSAYFIQVENEMQNLFRSLFLTDEKLILVSQVAGETLPTESALNLKQIIANLELVNNISFSRVEEFDGEEYDEQIQETFFTVNAADVHSSAVFSAIANQDFPDRKPQLAINNSDDFNFTIYFINDRVIFNPYDDRGGYIKFFKDEDCTDFVKSNTHILRMDYEEA